MELKNNIVAIGNIYVETNYIGLKTGGSDSLSVGKEYRAPKYELRLGGSAANFARQIKKLHGNIALIGKIGTDQTGTMLLKLLRDADVETELISVSHDPEIQTCVDSGLVMEHNGQNIQVVAGNANQKLALSDINFSLPVFDTTSVAYLGGFVKQESLYHEYPVLLDKFRQRNIQVFLDHGRIPVDFPADMRQTLTASLPFVTGYLPNADEIKGVSGKETISDAGLWALGQGVKFVVVKDGERGCMSVDASGITQIPAKNVTAVNTVGAGDVFNAAFIFRYMNGSTIADSAAFANAAAAYKVSTNNHPGVSDIFKMIQ